MLSALRYEVSTLAFLAMLFIRNPYVNSLFLLIAKLSASCSAGVVWSIYIPELSKSGMVASANGVIDSSGYALASLFNLVFSSTVGFIGWRGLIVIWSATMLFSSLAVVFSYCRGYAKNPA